MKALLIATVLLVSGIASASSNYNISLANDIQLILQDAEVRTFLGSEDIGTLNSIEVAGQAKCEGGPRYYSLKLTDWSQMGGAKLVTKSVSIGTCGVKGSTNVSIEK